MAGFWSYNDWPYYSPSSSNLSAFAPPFSVNKSTSNDVSAPFVDLAESADAITSNHFPPCSYGYDSLSNPLIELDSTPFSKPYSYGYTGLQVIDPPSSQLPHGLASNDAFAYDNCCDSIKLSVLEAQQYYPQNISSPTHDVIPSAVSNHWSPSSGFSPLDWSSLNHYPTKSSEIDYSGQSYGLWNQYGEVNEGKSKHVEVGSSLSSKETNSTGLIPTEIFMNPGCQDVKGSNNGEVSYGANLMNCQNYSVSIGADQLDDKSRWWQTKKSMPVDFSSTFVQGTPSVSQETHCEPAFESVADSGNHHLLYPDLRQHDKPARVDTGSSAPITVVVKNLDVGIAADRDLDSNNFYNMKGAYPISNSRSLGCSDIGKLGMHRDYEPTLSNNGMLSDWNASRDVVDYIFKARPGIQNHHANLSNSSLRPGANEGANSIDKSFDDVDQYNPAVDSPRWKRTAASHIPLFEAPESLHPQSMKKSDECFGSNLQGPQTVLLDTDNNVKSCEIASNNQIHNKIDCPEKGLEGSPINFSVTNFASEEYNSDGATNAGPFQPKPSCNYGLPCLDDISKRKENSMALNKSMYACESKPSNAEQQIIEENKCMSQKQHSLSRRSADSVCNVNESLECSTSQAAEQGLCSPCIVDAPSELNRSAEKVSAPKINIQMLVKMMHNMSELLLGHCLNDACELNEQDRNILENVISNLGTCALKDAEQMSLKQKCRFPQSDSGKHAVDSPEIQQNPSFERPHLTKVGPEHGTVELENLPVKDMKNHHSVSGKEYGKGSDSSSNRGDDTEMKKVGKMTQAIKRILSENFHDEEGPDSQTLLYKNLWLEAEAALCSINYRARYNQMLIEMGKHSCKQRDNSLDKGEQSKPEVGSELNPSQSSATEVNSFHSAQDCRVLNASNLKELSGSKFSPDPSKPITSTPEGICSQNVDSFVQDSTVLGTNKEAEDCEASVLGLLARLYVLKSRDDRSCIYTSNLEDLSTSESSHALETAPELASGGTDSLKTQNQVSFTQDSPIPAKEQANDLEASVMVRFHILKSRVEDSNSMFSKGHVLDGVGFAGNGIDAPERESFDVNTNLVMRLSSCNAMEKSSPKDHQEIQPLVTYRFGNQPSTDHSDGFSSDWEHVKEGGTCKTDFEILRAQVNDWMNAYMV